jgi:signal transduction histidine kinase
VQIAHEGQCGAKAANEQESGSFPMGIYNVLDILLDICFITLGIQALVDCLRHRDVVRRDVACWFVVLALPFFMQILTFIPGEKTPPVASYVSLLALILEPYLLLRLVRYLRHMPAKMLRVAFIAMVATTLVYLLFGSRAPSLIFVVIAYLIGLNIYAMVEFVYGALNSTGAAQQRLRFAAAGSILFALIFVAIMLALIIPKIRHVALFMGEVIAIICAITFYTGFAPPRWLLRLWQLSEAEQYLTQISQTPIATFAHMTQIATDLCRVVSRAVGGSAAGILQKDATSQQWALCYMDEAAQTFWNSATSFALDWESATPKYVRTSKQLSEDEGRLLAAAGADALLMAPIVTIKGVWGLLVVFLRYGSLFIEDDLHFISRLAERSAVVITNFELIENLQHYAENLAEQTTHLIAANRELDAFSYSVSHDLRAPLRAVDGFSQALLDDYNDALDDAGRDFLHRLRAESQRMGQLIDDLIGLSRLSRTDLQMAEIDLSAMVCHIAAELQETDLARNVEFAIQDGVHAYGDERLLHLALQNLLGNAWKFTARQPRARIEFGCIDRGQPVEFYVRDNGAGFDMAYANKLFGPFQRLHAMEEFAGTGIGLATVQRIVHRHGGSVRAEGAVGEGATFYFRLGSGASAREEGESREPHLAGRR